MSILLFHSPPFVITEYFIFTYLSQGSRINEPYFYKMGKTNNQTLKAIIQEIHSKTAYYNRLTGKCMLYSIHGKP